MTFEVDLFDGERIAFDVAQLARVPPNYVEFIDRLGLTGCTMPIRNGFDGVCARAANGDAVTPPTSARNCRRFIARPQADGLHIAG
jgi:hypothetical protein